MMETASAVSIVFYWIISSSASGERSSVTPKRSMAGGERLWQALDHGVDAGVGRERHVDAEILQRDLRERGILSGRVGQHIDRPAGCSFQLRAASGKVGGQRLDVSLFTLAGQLEDVLPHGGRAVFIRRPLVHVVGVALDGDKAGAGHLRRFRRAEVRRHGIVRILVVILAERDADREDRRFHAVFLQDRVGERVVAEIAVVKRDDDRLFRQRLAPQDEEQQGT